MILDRNIWEPINSNQLADMKDDDLQNLLSVCWHDGKFRCETIGISDINLDQHFSNGRTYFTLRWSDRDGDPKICLPTMDTPIDNIGYDSKEWLYGLFRKKSDGKTE